jgi:DNA-binding NtrC family response regulator
MMCKGSLLLVDDDLHVLKSMADWLREEGFDVVEAATLKSATDAIDSHTFDLAICDIRLSDGDGFQLLSYCREHHPALFVILMTGYGTAQTAVEAIRCGAFDFLSKPLIDEELKVAIDRALSQRKVMRENDTLKAQLDLRFGMDNVIGHDHRMQRIFEIINSVADTKSTVLITGESGTGKSMLARAIHRRSSRKNKPFVEVACGALPESLLESELFGHVAGAFTGANSDRQGKFHQAQGGTIFLDEIATASPAMQVKMLRVLQEYQFEQVGGSKTFTADIRVILATNESLEELVERGDFRKDLFYRINVINLELPPLRNRIADIPILARHFLETICDESGKQVDGFSEEAMHALQRYSLPGNVRELQNIVERAILLGKGKTIVPEDLPENVHDRPSASVGEPKAEERRGGCTLKEALEGPERQIILEVLTGNNWNRNEAAQVLGINRTTLYKKMKKLGLEDPRYTASPQINPAVSLPTGEVY